MRTRKIALGLLICVCITSIVIADSIKYVPKGPNDTAEFEKGLYELLPIYAWGVYPSDKILSKGVSEKDLDPNTASRMSQYKEKIDIWLTRVLKEELKPNKFNRADWLGIRKLRGGTDYIVGKFVSTTKESATIEFQADDRNIALTINSPLLFVAEANELSDSQILDFITKILNIPQEKISKISVEKHFANLGGINICYGKMRCEWDERKSPLNEQDWWSYIPFWYVKGKIFVSISTIEGGKGNFPVSPKNTWSF